MKINKIILSLFFLFSFSSSVFAETLPPVLTYNTNGYSGLDHTAACKAYAASIGHTVPVTIVFLPVDNSPQYCFTSGGYFGGVTVTRTCPAGGEVTAYSGGQCANVPACISPLVRNPSTTLCYTPNECVYPETDNGSGVCANNTCPSGQTRNPTTKLCQIKPTCGSTESYDIYTNTCKSYPLPCPGHTHANTANDACLPDAPLACPTGQHDDGTYSCVANDAKGCTSEQQGGYINGVLQCIKKTNLPKTADELAQAKLAMDTAIANATLAQAALAADPTNESKQSAYSSSLSAVTSKTTEFESKQKEHDSAALKSIDETLKALNNAESSQTAKPSDIASLDANQTSTTSLMQTAVGEGDFISSAFSYPSETACMTVPMYYKSLHYVFDPCQKLATFRSIFGWCLYVMTAFTLYDIATKRT